MVFNPATTQQPERGTLSSPILVNGQPTSVSLLSTPQLALSPLLPLLRPFMDLAFRASVMRGPLEYLPPSHSRLQTDTQILDEIGPDAFTYIVSTPVENLDSLKVYASVSAKPYTGKAVAIDIDEVVRAFKRGVPIEALDPNVEQWELMLMAVDVALQKQGIAGKLMTMVESELRRRTHGNGKEVHILLSTLKELNFEYYTKKGFTWTAEKKFEKGVHGSRDGFTMVEMMKKV